MDLTTSSATISLVFCLFLICVVLIFLVLAIHFPRRRRNLKLQAFQTEEIEEYEDFLINWQGWHLFYRGYKDRLTWSRYFYLLYSLRVSFPMLLSSILIDSPLSQASINLSLNALLLYFVIKARPLRKKINQIQLLMIEMTLLMINLSVFFNACFDHSGVDNPRIYVLLGDLVIVGSFCINVITVVFLPLKLGIEGYVIYKRQQSKENVDLSEWVRLLAIPLQQAAFGFEEIFQENFDFEEEKNSELEDTKDNLLEMQELNPQDVSDYNIKNNALHLENKLRFKDAELALTLQSGNTTSTNFQRTPSANSFISGPDRTKKRAEMLRSINYQARNQQNIIQEELLEESHVREELKTYPNLRDPYTLEPLPPVLLTEGSEYKETKVKNPRERSRGERKIPEGLNASNHNTSGSEIKIRDSRIINHMPRSPAHKHRRINQGSSLGFSRMNAQEEALAALKKTTKGDSVLERQVYGLDD